MESSAYISGIQQACEDAADIPDLKAFVSLLRSGIDRRRGAKAGGRRGICDSFSEALPMLLPSSVELLREQKLQTFVPVDMRSSCCSYLLAKQIDFVLRGHGSNDGRLIFIEFKTNLDFNNLSAAIVEMMAVKKFVPSSYSFRTASLQLVCPSSNDCELQKVNQTFGSPLDHIWTFCKKVPPHRYTFDVSGIANFQKKVSEFLAS